MLTLGEYRKVLSADELQSLSTCLARLYSRDDRRRRPFNSRMDCVATWTDTGLLSNPDPAMRPEENTRSWFISTTGQHMAVVRGPVDFVMGSPRNEPGRESPSTIRTNHSTANEFCASFAIAIKETTVADFRKFDARPDSSTGDSLDSLCPIVGVTWYDAAKYCRWLSEQERASVEDQMCFPADR